MPLFFALALAGVSVGVFVAVTYASLAMGVSTMDRPAIRYNVLKEAELNGLDPKMLMALIYSESQGDPKHYAGDKDVNGIPCSFGPGQFNVYRLDGSRSYSATAQQFGYGGDGSDLLDDATGVHYTALVLKDKLAQANGDYAQAILLYKGGKNANALAVAERDEVFTYYDQFFGNGKVA